VQVAFIAVGLVSIAIVLACLPAIRRAARDEEAAATPAAAVEQRGLAAVAA
jgi:hypothetical protein